MSPFSLVLLGWSGLKSLVKRPFKAPKVCIGNWPSVRQSLTFWLQVGAVPRRAQHPLDRPSRLRLDAPKAARFGTETVTTSPSARTTSSTSARGPR